jgi:hypothetical protein
LVRRADVQVMENAGDYFVALQPERPLVVVEPAGGSTGAPKRRRRLVLVVVAAVVAAGLVVVSLIASATGPTRRPIDTRPVAVPASMGGLPLATDANAQTHIEQMLPFLHKIFGSNGSASAHYGRSVAFLLAGRGPIDHAKAGDVRQTTAQRYHFGDITCAPYKFPKLKSVKLTEQQVEFMFVCWYSTPTFGASLLATRDSMGGMSEVAAALDAAIPGMRGDAG